MSIQEWHRACAERDRLEAEKERDEAIDDEMAVAARLLEENARAEKLEAFKAFVHRRLDDAGVPVDPPGEHRDAGCRIGQRLDWLFAERDAARASEARLREVAEVALAFAVKVRNEAGHPLDNVADDMADALNEALYPPDRALAADAPNTDEKGTTT